MIAVLESIAVNAPSVAVEEFGFSEGTGADVMQTGAACLLIDWPAVYENDFDYLVGRIVSKDRPRQYGEDAVQEAIIKTLDSNARGTAFSGEAIVRGVNLGGYLWTVASRLNIDGIRAEANISNIKPAGHGYGIEDEQTVEIVAPLDHGDVAETVGYSDARYARNMLDQEKRLVGPAMPGAMLDASQYDETAGCNVLATVREHGDYETVEMIRRALDASGKGQTREGNVRYVKILALRAAGLDQNAIARVLDIPVGNLPKMYQRAAKMAQNIMAGIDSEIPAAI